MRASRSALGYSGFDSDGLIAPADYLLFPHLKKELRGSRSMTKTNSNELSIPFSKQNKKSIFGGLEKIIRRWEKCVTIKGPYIEK